MYFTDAAHEWNYEMLKNQFRANSSEYKAACYITAAPLIFTKVEPFLKDADSPVAWIYRWEEKSWPQLDYENEREYKERIAQEVPFHLTESMAHMGRLALNLWGGYTGFNLRDCMVSIDEENMNVLRCAIDIRAGKYD